MGGPESGPMGPNTMGPGLNSDNDGRRSSPVNGTAPGTPRDDPDFNLGGYSGAENVSRFS